MGSKRAVSPLIATIILIALTVSIGALVVSWARNYIATQLTCSATHVTINSYTKGASMITITVTNDGNVDIPLNSTDLSAVVVTTQGIAHTCTISQTLQSTKCNLLAQNDVLKVGGIASLSIAFGNDLPINNVASIVLTYGKCGQISNQIAIS